MPGPAAKVAKRPAFRRGIVVALSSGMTRLHRLAAFVLAIATGSSYAAACVTRAAKTCCKTEAATATMPCCRPPAPATAIAAPFRGPLAAATTVQAGATLDVQPVPCAIGGPREPARPARHPIALVVLRL